MRETLFLIYNRIAKIISMCGVKRFYPVRVVHNFIFFHLMPNSIELQGNRIFLDSRDSLNLLINRFYEPLETEFVKKEIKKNNVVLDIGANIGYYTLLFARLVGEKGKVFAFEPDPDNFNLLKKNVEINNYKNVVLVQKAVLNNKGKIKLYLSGTNKGDHRVYDSHDDRQFIEIESIRLDDYFKNYNRKIDFIKIDIEGAEWEALQGMFNLLKKNQNLKILTEFWPIGFKRSGIEPREYLKLLIGHGFELYHINKQKKRIEAANISKLLEIYTPEKENHTNLLGIKK